MTTASSSCLPDGAQPPIRGCHPCLCDQYSEKGFLHPAGLVAHVEGRNGTGSPRTAVGELISGLASPPTRHGGAGGGRGGGHCVLLLVLAFLKLTKTMPDIPREERMGEVT